MIKNRADKTIVLLMACLHCGGHGLACPIEPDESMIEPNTCPRCHGKDIVMHLTYKVTNDMLVTFDKGIIDAN